MRLECKQEKKDDDTEDNDTIINTPFSVDDDDNRTLIPQEGTSPLAVSEDEMETTDKELAESLQQHFFAKTEDDTREDDAEEKEKRLQKEEAIKAEEELRSLPRLTDPKFLEYKVSVVDAPGRDKDGVFDQIATATNSKIVPADESSTGNRTFTMSIQTLRQWVACAQEFAVMKHIEASSLGANTSPWARRQAAQQAQQAQQAQVLQQDQVRQSAAT